MKIKNFIFILNLSIVVLLSVFLFAIYKYQQNRAIEIVIEDLKKDLLDSKYVAVKFLNDTDKIYMLRPYFDREIARNPLIRGFLLKRGKDNLFISGDVDLKAPLDSKGVKNTLKHITLNDLLYEKAFYIPIEFYSTNEHKIVSYKLYVFLNKSEIKEILNSLKIKYLLFYFIAIFIIFIVINYLTTKYLVKPLLKIKEITQKRVKNAEKMPIYELEDIKNSILESFNKLDRTIKKLYLRSITDPLTKLGNRKMLLKEVNNLIKKNKKFCLVFIDLDNFKEINDYYGHSMGDKFIKEVARKLREYIMPTELLTRIGGDEFVLILRECEDRGNLEVRLYKLLELLEQKWVIQNHEIITSASIGVAIYPQNGTTFDELLKNSDIAMYQAKHLGKNKFVIFDNSVKDKVNKEFELKNRLKKACENEEFVLYYQPKVDRDGKVFGAEALIRWINNGEIIPPNVFIPLAEKSGLIYEIGNWVIRQVAKDVKEWESDEILRNISVAFNVSVVQMRHENFLFDVQKALAPFNVDVSKLQIEITESLFIENKKRAMYLLGLLKKMGFKINLDDFGTGYSSISVLKDFEIDVLKIDKSFVDEVEDKKGNVYVKTIVDMSKNLNIKTIAEGVESKKQFEILKNMGVDYFQGYYFAKPLPKEEFIQFVKLNRS